MIVDQKYSNPNNQETQEDESDVDDNFAEEVEQQTECAEGRYVLVNFFTSRGKQTYKYVCQITQTAPLLVQGYKTLNDKRRFQKIPKDISEIDRCDIVAFLPKPVEDENYVEFPFAINTQELPK